MRVQLVLLCVVVLCVMTTMAWPFKGGRGRKGGRKDKGGCLTICRLTNSTAGTSQTAECKERFECPTESDVDFLIRNDPFSATFCKKINETSEIPESDREALPVLVDGEAAPESDDDAEKYIKFLLRRACNIFNGTDDKPGRGCCRTDEECTLGPIGIEKDDVFLTATYCEDAEEEENWLEVLNGERGDDSSEASSEGARGSSEESIESARDSSEGSSESNGERAARRRNGGRFRFGQRGTGRSN